MVREGKDEARAEIPPNSVIYIESFGGWLFIPISEKVWEAHLLYKKGFRGKFALEHSKNVFESIKNKCDTIVGEIGLINRHACRFVEKLGCELIEVKRGDYYIDDRPTDIGVYRYEFKEIR